MSGLFKSKKQKFIDGMNAELSRLIKIAQSRGALDSLSNILTPFIGDNIYNADFEKSYDKDIAIEKDLRFNISFFKELCITSIIIHEVVNPIVDPVVHILSKMQRILVTEDDYGDYQYDRWFKELDDFYINKLSSDIDSWFYKQDNFLLFFSLCPERIEEVQKLEKIKNHDDSVLFHGIKRDIKNAILDKISEYDDNNQNECKYDEAMTDHEYKHFVAEQFENLGFSTQVTKDNSDHGANILVEYNNARIAIQCKHYHSPIGNKAVREVHSAKDIVDCNLAAVVTNNTFTPAARDTAEKLSVLLLHHEDIPSLCAYIVGDDE